MAAKAILTIPDPLLKQESGTVEKINKEVKNVIKDLTDTLDSAEEPEGAGLSAPQIGVPKKICIVRKFLTDPSNSEKPATKDYILINPKIIKFSKEKESEFEGCLSVPNEYGRVERPKKIKVKTLDKDGKETQINASGFFARTIQHEVDHLNGILFIDRVIEDTVSGDELDQMYAKITV